MSDNQFNCPACGGNFQSKEEQDLHVQQTHSKKDEQQQEHSMMCSKCGFKANVSSEVENHNKQVLNDPKHTEPGQQM